MGNKSSRLRAQGPRLPMARSTSRRQPGTRNDRFFARQLHAHEQLVSAQSHSDHDVAVRLQAELNSHVNRHHFAQGQARSLQNSTAHRQHWRQIERHLVQKVKETEARYHNYLRSQDSGRFVAHH